MDDAAKEELESGSPRCFPKVLCVVEAIYPVHAVSVGNFTGVHTARFNITTDRYYSFPASVHTFSFVTRHLTVRQMISIALKRLAPR